jgi:hypothetical protein
MFGPLTRRKSNLLLRSRGALAADILVIAMGTARTSKILRNVSLI